MVEKVQGNGQDFRDVLQDMGRNSFDFKNHIVEVGNKEAEEVLAAEIDKIKSDPEMDSQTVLLEDVLGSWGNVRVLSQPISRSYRYLPNPNDTYLAMLRGTITSRVFEVLVLASNPESAADIAFRNVSKRRFEPMSADVFKIDPEEFILILKDRIDNGEKIPGRLLKYSKMDEYEQKVKMKRNNQSR